MEPPIHTETLVTNNSLEALAVDNGGSALVVLLLGDPHLLEGRQGRQDGATDPYGVLSLGGSDDLDLDGGGSQSGGLVDAAGLHSEEGRLEEGLRATESLITDGDDL